MSTAAALLIPGCLCCEKTGICDCSDLDLTKAVGLRLDVPNWSSVDWHFPNIDPFYNTRDAVYGRDYRGTPDVILGGAPGCIYQIELTFDCRIDRGTYARECAGHYPFFCWEEIITEGVNFKAWPQFVVHLRRGWGACGVFGVEPGYSSRVIESTGEGMMQSYQDYLESDGTEIVLRIPSNAVWAAGSWGPTGPISLSLWYWFFRFSADCFIQIKDAQCIDSRVRPW